MTVVAIPEDREDCLHHEQKIWRGAGGCDFRADPDLSVAEAPLFLALGGLPRRPPFFPSWERFRDASRWFRRCFAKRHFRDALDDEHLLLSRSLFRGQRRATFRTR